MHFFGEVRGRIQRADQNELKARVPNDEESRKKVS
jgi:hypothetical protein